MATEEELSSIIGRLSLREGEATRHSTSSLTATRIDPFLTIIGKLHCPRVVTHDSIATHCRNIWSLRRGFAVRPVGENLVHFKFNDRIDRARVMQGEPWLLGRKYPLVLQPSYDLSADFDLCPWWIHLYNCSLDLMNEEFARFAGNLIGEFVEVFTDANRNCIGRFLRIKFKISLKKPLMRVLQFEHEGRDLNFPLQYERLAEWCYHCGIISHVESGCPTKPPSVGNSSKSPEYGPWLRAKGYWNPFVSKRPANVLDPFFVPDDSDEEVAPWSERQFH
ncbi:OLC1v1023835C1 [Oldenlandia corymbosa var. corymbosa]|uniref:OLC1v1023835C1 n=1 Tax=Oldenlandia corymbosa var. corymbosa TaxID=529605 RepID=A0AAV1C0V3_OLDCO|nr:OLC1v1023835C1 [Oldenlandia corymbosa var. corymbosa]